MLEGKSQDKRYDDLPPFEFKSLVMRKRAFKGNLTIHQGLSNHCSVKGDQVFHLYLDCDVVKLNTIFDGILLLRKRFPELAMVKFLIISTSPFHFSLAAFVRLSWERYVKILCYAVKIGIEHKGHALYAMNKGYGVLRTKGKLGIVPRIMASIGDTIVCKTCMQEFTKDIREG